MWPGMLVLFHGFMWSCHRQIPQHDIINLCVSFNSAAFIARPSHIASRSASFCFAMAAAVIAYIQNLGKYLDSQKKLLGPALFEESLKSITGSITMQIQAVQRLTPEDATAPIRPFLCQRSLMSRRLRWALLSCGRCRHLCSLTTQMLAKASRCCFRIITRGVPTFLIVAT